ncbi:membrane protein insertion efficiency factor YidD, partial [Gemmiger formicilis]|nr:membrane protein insertion efficiency factor YidD [Gemmiger formicilis]
HLGHHCRFVPTCSEYAMQALAVHGLVKGLILTVWRLLQTAYPVFCSAGCFSGAGSDRGLPVLYHTRRYFARG